MRVAVAFKECVVDNGENGRISVVEIRAVETSAPVGEESADTLLVTLGKRYFDFLGGDAVVKPLFQKAVDFVQGGGAEFTPDTYLDHVALDFVQKAYNAQPLHPAHA